MEPVNGRPLIVDRASCLSHTEHGTSATIVVLRSDRPDRRAALAHLRGLILIDAPEPDAGMGASIAAGIGAVPDWSSAALILPADMPAISQDDIKAMREAHAQNPRAILRGVTSEGQLGHPVLFPRLYFKELKLLSGDKGARCVLQRHSACVEHVLIPADGAVLDLDTPEAWDAWNERTP